MRGTALFHLMTKYSQQMINKKGTQKIFRTALGTRLMYNCAHLRSTKESLTFEYLDILFLYHVSIGQHWLIHDGTGSV